MEIIHSLIHPMIINCSYILAYLTKINEPKVFIFVSTYLIFKITGILKPKDKLSNKQKMQVMQKLRQLSVKINGKRIATQIITDKIKIKQFIMNDYKIVDLRSVAIVNLIYCLSSFSYIKCIKYATQIEKLCYNRVIKDSKVRYWKNIHFRTNYTSKINNVLRNLDPESSVCKTYGPYLLNSIKNNGIKEDMFFNSIKLNPDSSKELRVRINLQSQQKIKTKVSNFYKCFKCKQRSCIYSIIQTRALDEAPTIYCTCTNCGNRFVAN